MEGGELAEEGYEGAFAEGVGEAGVEGEGGMFLGEGFDPFRLIVLSVLTSRCHDYDE